MVEAVQDSLNIMMEAFNQRLDSIQGQLPTTQGSPGSLAAELSNFKTFVIATFRALQSQIAMLAHQVDQGEMRARRKILLVHGLPEERDEDTGEVVVKVVMERLKLSAFSTADIGRCHRMGRVAADRPRPVLVKLRDVGLRDKIWASKTGLKGSGVTISEFLTKTRHDVFVAARQRFGISKCWTREGSIYVLAPDGSRHRVNNIGDLAAIDTSEAPTTAAAKPKTAAKGPSVAAGDVGKTKSKRVLTKK